MKAISLWQPWASLIALGVKTIETRSWSTNYRGPLAIHATKKIPSSWTRVGEHRVHTFGRQGLALLGPGLPEFRSTPKLEGYLLPLGKIVATCMLTAVVPMVAEWPSASTLQPCLYAGRNPAFPRLALWREGQPPFPSEDVEDQAPYGDYSPGRFAWLLDDIAPVTERCPECWGTGAVNDNYALECSTCHRNGSCDPIPAQGHQRLWEWTP